MQKKWKDSFCGILVCLAVTQFAIAQRESITTTGKVTDDQGRPVGGAEIRVVPGGNDSVYTESLGQFTYTWRPPSWLSRNEKASSYVVARHKARNIALALPVDNKGGTIQLALEPAMSVSGSVTDTEGNAISGVRVSLMFRTPDWGKSIEAQRLTAGETEFTFKALPAENLYLLWAHADGYGRRDIKFDAQDAVNGCLDLGRIELPLADMSVSGRVLDIKGQPVPGAEVYCSVEGSQARCHTQSDKQGDFILQGLCAGPVRIFVEKRVRGGEFMSCQIFTEAGARDIKVVVREGHGYSCFVRAKPREQIIQSANPYVAGKVVDEDGRPVADVPVCIRCVQAKNAEGKDTESYFNLARFGDVTDEQGRFIIELKETATYSLLFSPIHQAAVIAYDVRPGTGDLSVTLPAGGTLTGRLLRIQRGRQLPIAHATIELKQTERISYTHIGFDRDRKTVTDAEGRFRFEHVRTLIRHGRGEFRYAPRVWELYYQDARQTVQFEPGEQTKKIDFILRPQLKNAQSLIDRPLPEFHGIDIQVNPEQNRGKSMLICFFDYEQRPSRRCVQQLSEQAKELRDSHLEIIAVQCSEGPKEDLAAWIAKLKLPFPVGTLTRSVAEVRFDWNVQSLPWFILTDAEHVVRAQGFSINELDGKLKQNEED